MEDTGDNPERQERTTVHTCIESTSRLSHACFDLTISCCIVMTTTPNRISDNSVSGAARIASGGSGDRVP